MTVFLNEWAIRLCRSAAIAIAVCFGFLLGYYYCERSVIFDDIKKVSGPMSRLSITTLK